MDEFEKQQSANYDPDLARLCPELSPAQLEEANNNLREYVALALRVFERLERDPEAMARFEALTAQRRASRINGKGQPNHPQQNP
jgi:hypothetical protein